MNEAKRESKFIGRLRRWKERWSFEEDWTHGLDDLKMR